MMNFIRSLGSADWKPTAGNDNACYTLDDRILIDTGSAAEKTLLDLGIDPVSLKTICFTHMHADHCMGLLPLLLYWRIRMNGDLSSLTLTGPAETLRPMVQKAIEYVFPTPEEMEEITHKPRLIELKDGDRFETEDYHVSVIASDHAVEGLCYRFTDKASGHTAGFSGDTRYREAFGPFFQDVDVLVYEASAGAGPVNPKYNRICRHSSAMEAVRTAREAGAKQLILTHSTVDRQSAAVQYAAARLDIPVAWATPLKVFPY